ncbi:O-antigen ligase family protein [Heliophilum fasciatum]|uniref:O-antigen ligase n=1 Tax=Heliophilum fasciatum TaxID=35700 RepID=A0A4V2SWX3_9FIRM|nr:O-antigen ligase family protein [Heliophilum fasciatum]MCW2278839.1 O-antigen ligase [Heliophilum fasciatum]TCP64076.1 O-antigen ligase [Heliophilum fasciatum]
MQLLVFLLKKIDLVWQRSWIHRGLERFIALARQSVTGRFVGDDPYGRMERLATDSQFLRLWRLITAPLVLLRRRWLDLFLPTADTSLVGNIVRHLAVPEGWQLAGISRAGVALVIGWLHAKIPLITTGHAPWNLSTVLLPLLIIAALYTFRTCTSTVAEVAAQSWIARGVAALFRDHDSEVAAGAAGGVGTTGTVGAARAPGAVTSPYPVAPALSPVAEKLMFLLLFGLGAGLGFLASRYGDVATVALLLALVALQLLIFRPALGLIGIAAFSPIDWFLRLQLPASVAAIWDKGLFVLMIAAIGAHWLTRRDFRWRGHPLFVALTAFNIIMITLFLIDHTYPRISVPFEGLRVVIQHTFWFYLAIQLLERPAQSRRFLIFFALIATGIAAFGVYQYIIKVPMPENWVDKAESITTRAFSIVQSPNVLGSLLVLTTPIALGLTYQSHRWQRWFFLACAGVMAACMVVTFSRGAWLGLGIAIVLFSLLQDRRIIAILLIGALLLPAAAPSVADRVSYLLSPSYFASSAKGGRIDRWNLALEKVQQHPMTGIGLGQFGGAAAERNAIYFSHKTLYTDNYYLKTAAETGLVGLFSLLGLILATIRFSIGSALHTARRYRPLAAGVACGIIGVALHNAVENVFEVPMMVISFWFCVALLGALRRRGEE